MNQIITKRIKAVKAFKTALIIGAIIDLCLVFAMQFAAMSILFVALFLGFLIYFGYFAPFKRVIKLIGEDKMRDTSKDINLHKADYKKSKIHCGSQALYFAKKKVVVPYDEITWVYLFVYRIMFIPVLKQTHFMLKNGTGVAIKCNVNEVKDLLDKNILPANPYVMIGHTDANLNAYNSRVKSYKESLKR